MADRRQNWSLEGKRKPLTEDMDEDGNEEGEEADKDGVGDEEDGEEERVEQRQIRRRVGRVLKALSERRGEGTWELAHTQWKCRLSPRAMRHTDFLSSGHGHCVPFLISL